MKKVYHCLFLAGALFLMLFAMTEAQAQTPSYAPWREINPATGQRNPGLDFMILTRDANHPYVNCGYGDSYGDYNTHPGTYTQGNAISHSHYIYDRSNTNNGTMVDPCRCENVASTGQTPRYVHEKVLPPSWSGVQGEVQDKVIRLGCYNLNTDQCKRSQEIEYWFYPPKDSSTLLVYFTFCQEIGAHPASQNPRFYIEVMDENHNLIPSGSYEDCNETPQTQWPYNRFLAVPSGNNSNQDSYCPDYTGITNGTWYWAFPEATPTTFDYHICPTGQTSGYSHSENDVQWFEYKPLAFDLKSYADSGQANAQSVKLRMRVRSCNSRYHWAYCMFAAKLIPGYITVDACGQDVIDMSVPWGFNENMYEWHYGLDRNNSNSILNLYSPPPGVSSTSKRHVVIDPSVPGARVWPYYRCEMKSFTGVPLTYEAYIKLYNIISAFSYKQIADNTDPCAYVIQLQDTGKVFELTPKAVVSNNDDIYDTTEQNPHKYVEWFYKNTAGDYQEIVPARNQMSYTFHVDRTGDVLMEHFPRIYSVSGKDSIPGGDSIWIKLVIQDSLQKCSDTIEMKIALDSSFVSPYGIGVKEDTAIVCKNKLPYFYQPDKYGQTYRFDRPTEPNQPRECHVGDDFNERSWNGCDSVIKVTLIVMESKVEIVDLGDYCDSFRTTLTVVPASNQNFQQEDIHVLNWNGDESETGIRYQAEHAGVYSVAVAIGDTGCTASASYKIPACLPFMNLPTSITPSNRDGINDCFEIPQKSLIQSLEFTVYNRNGTVVYHTKDVNFKWRGARFSEDYPDREFVNQTYVYVLKMVDYNGKPYPVMKGTVLVL